MIHNIFTNDNLTFEPNVNVATPENYRLGPGDEVIIDVWGASETTIRQTISPEGSIPVSYTHLVDETVGSYVHTHVLHAHQ